MNMLLFLLATEEQVHLTWWKATWEHFHDFQDTVKNFLLTCCKQLLVTYIIERFVLRWITSEKSLPRISSYTRRPSSPRWTTMSSSDTDHIAPTVECFQMSVISAPSLPPKNRIFRNSVGYRKSEVKRGNNKVWLQGFRNDEHSCVRQSHTKTNFRKHLIRCYTSGGSIT